VDQVVVVVARVVVPEPQVTSEVTAQSRDLPEAQVTEPTVPVVVADLAA
jgi:hypothetical protein